MITIIVILTIIIIIIMIKFGEMFSILLMLLKRIPKNVTTAVLVK